MIVKINYNYNKDLFHSLRNNYLQNFIKVKKIMNDVEKIVKSCKRYVYK